MKRKINTGYAFASNADDVGLVDALTIGKNASRSRVFGFLMFGLGWTEPKQKKKQDKEKRRKHHFSSSQQSAVPIVREFEGGK